MRFLIFSLLLIASKAFANGLDYACLAQQIEQNETSGKSENLVFWSENEPFPSLGIGHFIWLPTDLAVPFVPTFALMAEFVNQQKPAPKWVLAENPPWQNRTEFLAENPAKIAEIRNWLQQTKALQAKFIVQRFEQEIEPLLAKNQDIAVVYQQLSQLEAGQFALIDYVNFKGFGDLHKNPQESYQNQGWGLLQVLQQMQANNYNKNNLLAEFAKAADQVLTRRTELAPSDETRWLTGWRSRVYGYLNVVCVG